MFPPCFYPKNRYKRNTCVPTYWKLPAAISAQWPLPSSSKVCHKSSFKVGTSSHRKTKNVVSKGTTCLTLQDLQPGLFHIVSIFLRKPTSYEFAKSGVQTFGTHGTAAILVENRQQGRLKQTSQCKYVGRKKSSIQRGYRRLREIYINHNYTQPACLNVIFAMQQ